MKKLMIFLLIIAASATVSFGQDASKEKTQEKGGWFHRSNKPRVQMSHFESKSYDKNIKDNGTEFTNKRAERNRRKTEKQMRMVKRQEDKVKRNQEGGFANRKGKTKREKKSDALAEQRD